MQIKNKAMNLTALTLQHVVHFHKMCRVMSDREKITAVLL